MLSSFTEPARPFTRLIFSPEFSMAREWLKEQFEAANLECHIDAGGNLVGSRKALVTFVSVRIVSTEERYRVVRN